MSTVFHNYMHLVIVQDMPDTSHTKTLAPLTHMIEERGSLKSGGCLLDEWDVKVSPPNNQAPWYGVSLSAQCSTPSHHCMYVCTLFICVCYD